MNKIDKLVRGVDKETWTRFSGLCKMKGKYIGDELTKILREYVDKDLKRMNENES